MCGIAGWITTDQGRPDEAVLHRMCDAIHHRGPDSEGIFLDKGVALGARRLRIIDLAASEQPVTNEDGSITIVFNGEIYNFLEIRAELEALGCKFHTHGDTEVVIQAYIAWGDRFLDRLNGMFALALWDAPRQRLILARDRMGKKPLLLAQSGSTLVFGSEFSAVLAHPRVSREVDPTAIDHYLTLGYIPAPMTAYASIRKLRPGHMLIWEHGTLTERSYWSLEYSPKLPISDAEAIDQFRALFTDAVRLRMISDVPLGAFLSGGIDSASVVAAMAGAAQGRVKTFSVGFADAAYNELSAARLVAERYGTEHHEFIVAPRATELLPRIVQHYGEPYADSSALPTFELARVTRDFVTVALNGDGGDELFGGYDRYRALIFADTARQRLRVPPGLYQRSAALLPAAAGQRSLLGRTRRFLNGLALEPGRQYARWMGLFSTELKDRCYAATFSASLAESGADMVLVAPFEVDDDLSLAERAMKLDTQTYLPDDLLVKVDIATMASSLEGRSPFLDYRLVELAARLPLNLKIRRGVSKYIVKQAMRDALPPEILRKKKAGFGVPLAQWFRGDLRPMLSDVLLSDTAQARAYFQPGAVRRLVDEHVEGRADYAPQLWALLVLELWQQSFIDTATIDSMNNHCTAA